MVRAVRRDTFLRPVVTPGDGLHWDSAPRDMPRAPRKDVCVVAQTVGDIAVRWAALANVDVAPVGIGSSVLPGFFSGVVVPGIHLVPSRLGFSQSPLPARCRQATSCAWRTRLRKIPNRRSVCGRGHAKGSSGKHRRATVAAQTATSRNRSGISGGLGGPGGQKALQEAQRNRTTTRAIRYVQCGLVDMCA